MTFLKKYMANAQENRRNSGVIAYLAAIDHIHEAFPRIGQIIVQELKDQRSHLKLIASENYSSLAVQLAMGNLLTDKYAEGYPHHRFYAGCDNVDQVEDIARELLKQIFGCDHAYVQPHSGADANLVAFWSALIYRVQRHELQCMGKKSIDELTDEEYERIRRLLCNQKMMGMSLNSGGHLTHGYRHNLSGKFMQSVAYEVDPKTGLLDYQTLKEQVLREKPAILVAGYSAYSRLINFATMREIADLVGATLIVDMAHFAGLVAGKVMQGDFNPVPFAHFVTSTTHKTLRGPRGGIVLCQKEFQEVVDKGCPLVLGGPLPHVIAAKAIAFKEAADPSFVDYAHQIVRNAQVLAQELQRRGIPVMTGGTDNHLMVFNVTSRFRLTGRQAETALRQARLTVNRNAIPFDVNGPWYTSGIRIGTPATTTLGMKEGEMKEIAALIDNLLSRTQPLDEKVKIQIDPGVLTETHAHVNALLNRFPLYPELVI